MGKFLKSFSYNFFVNIYSTMISMVITLIVPKMIGVEDFGYFQLYMMFITFLGIFHLGWVDGVYLEYGGEHYHKLDSKFFSNQFFLFAIFQIFLATLFFIGSSLLYQSDPNKIFVYHAIAVTLVLYNVNIFIQFILLTTNNIKKYSAILFVDRTVYILLVIVFLVIMKVVGFKSLIYADIVARSISLLYAMYTNRRLILNKIVVKKDAIYSAISFIQAGYKVTFGGIAGIFITGISRLLIESKWGIAFFGKVSLSLTLSNLVMVMVNAISLSLFPVLKRLDEDMLKKAYNIAESLLVSVIFICMIFYYPLKVVLVYWLPNYAESLNYLAILFPLVLFNAKSSMIINTYLKTIRKEQYILISNIGAVIISTVLSIFSIFVLNNRLVTVLSIVISLAVRSFLGEMSLSEYLNGKFLLFNLSEWIVCGVFILISWNIDNILATFLFMLVVLIFLWTRKKYLVDSLVLLKSGGPK